MNKLQTQVKEFHEAFECVINESPTMPDIETCKLRIALIQEELDELMHDGFGLYVTQIGEIEKSREPNLTEAADAIGDLLYVVYGTAVSLGIDMEQITDEIHRSNMSKLWNGKVHKREDGKVIKSPDYSPANLEPIIESQM